MRLSVVVAGAVLAVLVCSAGCRADQTAVSFVSPRDGARVTSPVHLTMRARGIVIEPAGPIHKDAGHFHVMVDRDCFHPGVFVEMHTEGFEHFGDGASTGELALEPGKHTLCLQVGNGAHVTLRPMDKVTITVVAQR